MIQDHKPIVGVIFDHSVRITLVRASGTNRDRRPFPRLNELRDEHDRRDSDRQGEHAGGENGLGIDWTAFKLEKFIVALRKS